MNASCELLGVRRQLYIDGDREVHTDSYGHLTIVNAFVPEECANATAEAEMTPECRKAQQVAERHNFYKLVDHDSNLFKGGGRTSFFIG